MARWLPGLLRAHGSEITMRELMSDSSGLIDDNDVWESPSTYLARIHDARLRAQLNRIGARINTDPTVEISPLWFIRIAAWQPLVAPCGSLWCARSCACGRVASASCGYRPMASLPTAPRRSP